MRKLEHPPKINDLNLALKAVKLLAMPEVKEQVRRLNERYAYWDKVKYHPVPEGFAPVHLWTVLKFNRSLDARRVQFGRFNFEYNLTDTIQKGLHEFDMHIGGNLGSKSLIPEDDKKRYLVSSIMEEAIASSQIEGAVTSRKAAKQMLRENNKPRNKSEQMIVNNFQTIKHIVEIKDQPITTENLLHIHSLITSKTLDNDDDEGRYRGHNDIHVVDVTDGEIVYTPPPFEEVPTLMNALFDFFNKEDQSRFIHPVVKGCIIHFMIGYIHPFVDGNGRTARALYYWYLLKNGYWLTEYLSISRLIIKSKQQYALTFLYSETDENDLTYFIHYKIKTMQLAYAHLQEYIQRKIKEKKQLFHFQKLSGVNERQALILKWVYEEPNSLFKVTEIENRFNVSNQTARTDLTGLVDLGFLEEISLNKKVRAFHRSAQFRDLISDDKLRST